MDITKEQMIELIRNNVKGTAIVTVDLDSPLDGKGKMRKRNNPFHGVGIVKRVKQNGVIGYIYSNAVNKIASKEDKDEREAKMHPWGDMDDKRLFRTHRGNGNKYLTMKVESAKVLGFFRQDGTELNADETAEIKTFIPTKTKSSTQADLEGEVIARDYALTNITGFQFKGMYFTLIEGQVDQETTDKDETETETETE